MSNHPAISLRVVDDPFLPGIYEEFFLERDNRLLEVCGVSASAPEPQEFDFNQITVPAQLSYVSLIHDGQDVQICAEVGYELLQDVISQGQVMPLCLWAVDAIINHQTCKGGLPVLPERLHPEKKLIILTQGMFRDVGGKDYSRHVLLEEKESGQFQIKSIKKYETIVLYPKPGWNIVALCAPRSSCQKRPSPTT